MKKQTYQVEMSDRHVGWYYYIVKATSTKEAQELATKRAIEEFGLQVLKTTSVERDVRSLQATEGK